MKIKSKVRGGMAAVAAVSSTVLIPVGGTCRDLAAVAVRPIRVAS